jgi:hypothetical protein
MEDVPVYGRKYTEPLACDAFMGGLNTAYEIGRVLAGPDEVILDLDFSGAYAAAMACLPAIDWGRVRLGSADTQEGVGLPV